jgi:predicted DNA-binding transcriptional regulator AlpA
MKNGVVCLSKKKVSVKLGDASDTTIWRWVQSGRIPKPRQIGPNRVAWFEHELDEAILAFPVAEPKPVCPNVKKGRRKKTASEKLEVE